MKFFRPNSSKDSVRTANVKQQIKFSLIFKVATAVVAFAYVPIALRYLGMEMYGIWATILSVISWLPFIDMGMGNGLRNRVANSIAAGDRQTSRIYISTTFIILFVNALGVLLLVLIISPFIDFQQILKTTVTSNGELKTLFIIVTVFMLINFVISLQNQIISAFHKTQLTMLNQFIVNTIALVGTYLLATFTNGNLIFLAMVYGTSLLLGNLIVGSIFFRFNRDMLPSFLLFDKHKVNEISGLGGRFFIIQIAAIIIYSTDNIIITQVLGPGHVTTYDIAFKLFSLITMVHAIIIAPFWSACTDAYAKGDILWVRKAIAKLNILMVPFVALTVILGLFARDIVRIWIGGGIVLNWLLIVSMGLYAIVHIWSSNYAFILNGIGSINIQLMSAIVASAVNIPLAIFFSKTLALGSAGVMLGTVVSLSLFGIIGPIQLRYILNKAKSASQDVVL